MLLLLLSHTKFQLKDQFDLRQGVSMTASKENKKQIKDSSLIYKAVNLSGLDSCSGQILENRLVDYGPAREIPSDKLISHNDYLISCKGEVKGYSMLFSKDLISKFEKNNSGGLVASNHFLVLRPRMITETKPDEIYFLHNLLNIITSELRNLALSKPGIAKYLTIHDVASYTFNFPFQDSMELDDFKFKYTQYINSLEKFNKDKSTLQQYNTELAEKIIIKK